MKAYLVFIEEMLVKHADAARDGYIAIHDRSGNVMDKCDMPEELYDDQFQTDDHGPLPGEVEPGAKDDMAGIYDEVDDLDIKPGKIKKPKKLKDSELPKNDDPE